MKEWIKEFSDEIDKLIFEIEERHGGIVYGTKEEKRETKESEDRRFSERS